MVQKVFEPLKFDCIRPFLTLSEADLADAGTKQKTEGDNSLDVSSLYSYSRTDGLETWARGDKTFFMLNSLEHEIFPAHSC